MIDTGCQCLVALARLQQIPAEYAQLRHQFSDNDQPLTDNDLLRAGKALGFKARKVTSSVTTLKGSTLPAIAKATDGTYFIIARISDPTASRPDDAPIEHKALILEADQTSPQQIPLTELEARWNGELILLKLFIIWLHN